MHGELYQYRPNEVCDRGRERERERERERKERFIHFQNTIKWVFPFYATLYFYFTTSQRQILYFSLHYICLAALVTYQTVITIFHTLPVQWKPRTFKFFDFDFEFFCWTEGWSVPLRAEKILLLLQLNKLLRLEIAGKCIVTKLKTGCFSDEKLIFLEIRGSHRTATLQTHDDLIDHDALL